MVEIREYEYELRRVATIIQAYKHYSQNIYVLYLAVVEYKQREVPGFLLTVFSMDLFYIKLVCVRDYAA